MGCPPCLLGAHMPVYLQSPPDLHKTSKLAHPCSPTIGPVGLQQTKRSTEYGGDLGCGAVARRAFRPAAERRTGPGGPRRSSHRPDSGRSRRHDPRGGGHTRGAATRGRSRLDPAGRRQPRPRRDLGDQAAQLRHRPALRRTDAVPVEGARRTDGAEAFRRHPRRLRLLRDPAVRPRRPRRAAARIAVLHHADDAEQPGHRPERPRPAAVDHPGGSAAQPHPEPVVAEGVAASVAESGQLPVGPAEHARAADVPFGLRGFGRPLHRADGARVRLSAHRPAGQRPLRRRGAPGADPEVPGAAVVAGTRR